MLLLNQTRIHASTERKLSAGAVLKSEGAALVAVYEDNELRVKPSEGTSGEVFVGVAISAIASVTVAPKVEELVIDKDTATVELARLPITDKDIAVKVDGTSITVGTTADDSHAKLEKQKLTFGESLKGKTAVVTYRFSPNAEELYVVQGEQRPGVHVTTALGQTGVITSGEVLTSEFDVAADWTPKANGQLDVYLGANGLFTTTKANGTKLNAVVTRLPVAGSPYLGLQFHI